MSKSKTAKSRSYLNLSKNLTMSPFISIIYVGISVYGYLYDIGTVDIC